MPTDLNATPCMYPNPAVQYSGSCEPVTVVNERRKECRICPFDCLTLVGRSCTAKFCAIAPTDSEQCWTSTQYTSPHWHVVLYTVPQIWCVQLYLSDQPREPGTYSPQLRAVSHCVLRSLVGSVNALQMGSRKGLVVLSEPTCRHTHVVEGKWCGQDGATHWG